MWLVFNVCPGVSVGGFSGFEVRVDADVDEVIDEAVAAGVRGGIAVGAEEDGLGVSASWNRTLTRSNGCMTSVATVPAPNPAIAWSLMSAVMAFFSCRKGRSRDEVIDLQ